MYNIFLMFRKQKKQKNPRESKLAQNNVTMALANLEKGKMTVSRTEKESGKKRVLEKKERTGGCGTPQCLVLYVIYFNQQK